MATFPASHNIHTYDRYVRGAWLYFLSGDNERKFVLIANGNIEIYVVYFSLWYCILWVSSFQSSLFCVAEQLCVLIIMVMTNPLTK